MLKKIPYSNFLGRTSQKNTLNKKYAKVVELVGGGSVINGAYPVYFLYYLNFVHAELIF